MSSGISGRLNPLEVEGLDQVVHYIQLQMVSF